MLSISLFLIASVASALLLIATRLTIRLLILTITAILSLLAAVTAVRLLATVALITTLAAIKSVEVSSFERILITYRFGSLYRRSLTSQRMRLFALLILRYDILRL